MKKKLLSMVLSLCVIASMLMGCGSGKTESTGESSTTDSIATVETTENTANATVSGGEVVELNMYSSFGEEEERGKALQSVIDAFNTEYDGKIHVTVDINNDFPAYQEKVKTMIASGECPDIFHYNFNPNDLSRQKSDKLFDFTKYMDDEWASRFGDGDLETLTINGKITSIPFEKAGAVLYYNTDLFAQAGIESFPKTWDEMLEACDKLEAIGIEPFTLYTADDAWYMVNLFTYLAASSTGTETLNAGGSLNSDKMVEAATMLRKFMDYTTDDFIGANYSQAVANFTSGKTAMVFDGSWLISSLSKMEGKVAIANVPTNGDSVAPLGYLVTDAQTPWACADTEDPAKAEAYVTFMKYLTSEESTKTMTLKGGVFCSAKLELTDEEKADCGELMSSYIDVNSNCPASCVNLQRNLSTEAHSQLPSLLESLALDVITPTDFIEQLDSANNS